MKQVRQTNHTSQTNQTNQTNQANQFDLTRWGRGAILLAAFLGWLFAGVHMSITQMTAQPAAIDLLDRTGQIDADQLSQLSARWKSHAGAALSRAEERTLERWKATVARWFTWIQCAFLFGAASGGFLFGWLGDRIGRSKAMAASILTYSGMSALASLSQSPLQFWCVWFLACTGVGGMWPNGVAIVAEAWSSLSRPALAGVIGTAANIGIFGMSTIGTRLAIAHDAWRWVMLVGAMPLVLGLLALAFVPESPQWLAMQCAARDRRRPLGQGRPASNTAELFRPPLLGLTLVAILLGTVPMIGGWGTANWMNPWADETGNPLLKAQVGQARALAGIVGSLVGGWVASRLGRRVTYFLISLASLLVAEFIFCWMQPTDDRFLPLVAVLGFLNGLYFGWLPLCMPEFFPTRVRATGTGIGFNFGRLITAITLFVSGQLMIFFEGDYARVGRATSLLFLLGVLGIWLAPDLRQKEPDGLVSRSSVSRRQSAVSRQPSAVSSQQSAVSSRQSAVSSQQSVVGRRPSAVGVSSRSSVVGRPLSQYQRSGGQDDDQQGGDRTEE